MKPCKRLAVHTVDLNVPFTSIPVISHLSKDPPIHRRRITKISFYRIQRFPYVLILPTIQVSISIEITSNYPSYPETRT